MNMTNREKQLIRKSIINDKQKKSFQKRKFGYMNSSNDSNCFISHGNCKNAADDDQIIDNGKKPDHKPVIEENDESELDDHLIKRKAQNRAAQRAFRERKELYVKELEKKIKQVQESHRHATTQLYQENQQLRFIIYKLETEISNLQSVSVEKNPMSESCLLSVGPPPDLNSLLPSPNTSLPSLLPLQIRSASTESRALKIIPNDPDKKKKMAHHLSNTETENCEKSGNKKTKKKCVIAAASSYPTKINSPVNSTSCQQFTFSITTPDTLRENRKNESARKNEHIETVQLYPDHSHPANHLLERNSKNNTSPKTNITLRLSPINYCSNDSITSNSSEEDKTIHHIDRNNANGFNNSIFSDAANDKFNFTEFTSSPASSPTITLNQFLEDSSDPDWVSF